ncbi:hypothetical protein DPMN_160591 [Dreissena polymorpha]|uniref:Uncharacterized protein n=1 Tax=Dreissena polymorpha TaxID=45954 RepID=A0A9D4ERI1_DREPO|nr:hypothetical protein DPMN_160591 [Dreissena polymorpha]
MAHSLTRSPFWRLSTKKAGLVWTCCQAQLSMHDCFPRTTRGRLLLRQSEEKQDGQCERMDNPSHGGITLSSPQQT